MQKMRAVIQRVSNASVTVNQNVLSSIHHGLLIFVGIESSDLQSDSEWLAKKITSLRIFSDKDGKMNLNIDDVKGDILIVSQFTLHASTKKGNRPSYIKAARPEISVPLYQQFITDIKNNTTANVLTGEFGADMKVALTNDGPVTITIDSKNKE